MSKGFSGLFSGTLGSTFKAAAISGKSYTDRNIEIPKRINAVLSVLREKGDVFFSDKEFTMKDVSIMSKETGVEFARITIGDKCILVRGDEYGTDIPSKILKQMKIEKGKLDFHSHPHDDDCVPSIADRNLMRVLKNLTGQMTSMIVTPNGRTVEYNEFGVMSTGIVNNTIDDELKKTYLSLFGGNTDVKQR